MNVAARLRRRLRTWRRYCVPRSAAIQPIFLLTSGRVGSNLLASYLGSIAAVSVRGEVLNPDAPEGIRERFVTRAATLRHLRRSLYGLRPRPGIERIVSVAKLHLPQLERRGIGVDDLRGAFPDARYIVLFRRSLGAAYVSRLVARKTGQWLLLDDAARIEARVRVEPEDLRRYCQRMRAAYGAVAAVPWANGQAAVVSYEDLVGDPQGMFTRVLFPLLGLAPSPVRTTLRKQNVRPLSEIVENHAEVAHLLDGAAARHSFDPGAAPDETQPR
jgi:LPS sulfotransferase NodH